MNIKQQTANFHPIDLLTKIHFKQLELLELMCLVIEIIYFINDLLEDQVPRFESFDFVVLDVLVGFP